MVGLLVPFDLTAVRGGSRDGQRYLEYIDPSKVSGGKNQTSKNAEPFFQRGGEVDTAGTVVNTGRTAQSRIVYRLIMRIGLASSLCHGTLPDIMIQLQVISIPFKNYSKNTDFECCKGSINMV